LLYSKLMNRPFIPKSKIPSVADVGLQFSINGQVKQAGTAKDMIFGVPKLISFVSSIMRLEVCLMVRNEADGQEGDLILTGTPAGVGPLKAGEKFEAKLTYPGLKGEVLDEYSFDVVDRKGPYEFTG
jgi:acylpyruvate hydrolase